MTTCDEIEADTPGEQPSLIRLVLFFVMQGVAVILVGFAALFGRPPPHSAAAGTVLCGFVMDCASARLAWISQR